MKNIVCIIVASVIVAACGPVAPTIEEQCETQGGEWVCSPDAPGAERCWCDIAPEGEPS